MDHVITDNRAWVPTEIMVSAAIMAKTGAEIDAALGREQAAARSSTRQGTIRSSKRRSTAAGRR